MIDALLVPIDRIVHFIKVAGAASESVTERDGFLSYHAESHAVGTGLSVGFAFGVSSNWSALGGVATAILYGNRGDSPFEGKLLHDLISEKHYFLSSLVAGFIAGLVIKLKYKL